MMLSAQIFWGNESGNELCLASLSMERSCPDVCIGRSMGSSCIMTTKGGSESWDFEVHPGRLFRCLIFSQCESNIWVAESHPERKLWKENPLEHKDWIENDVLSGLRSVLTEGRSCACVSNTHFTSMLKILRVLAGEAWCLILLSLRTLKAAKLNKLA